MKDIVDLIEMLNNRDLTAFWKNDCLWVVLEQTEDHYQVLKQVTQLEKENGSRIPLFVKFKNGEPPRFYGDLNMHSRLWARFPANNPGAGYWEGKNDMTEEQQEELDEFISELTLGS